MFAAPDAPGRCCLRQQLPGVLCRVAQSEPSRLARFRCARRPEAELPSLRMKIRLMGRVREKGVVHEGGIQTCAPSKW